MGIFLTVALVLAVLFVAHGMRCVHVGIADEVLIAYMLFLMPGLVGLALAIAAFACLGFPSAAWAAPWVAGLSCCATLAAFVASGTSLLLMFVREFWLPILLLLAIGGGGVALGVSLM